MATHQLFLELDRQRRATGTDWLRDERLGEMDAFVEHIQHDRKLMAESLRESAVIAIDCGEFTSAARLLARSIRYDPGSPFAWRSVLYLVRKMAQLSPTLPETGTVTRCETSLPRADRAPD